MNSDQLNYYAAKQVTAICDFLYTHHDEQVQALIEEAAKACREQGRVAMYKALYSAAERLNPYKRKHRADWRKLCSQGGSQRCVLAQLFYSMAEGWACDSKMLHKVKLSTTLPKLD